jgi:ankyrin repeat protein
VEHGANVMEVDTEGKTPLHWAAGSGRAEVVKYLIDVGADANAKDSKGMTPLAEARFFGHKDIAELLAAHIASITPNVTK